MGIFETLPAPMLPFVVPAKLSAELVLLACSAETVVVGVTTSTGFALPPAPDPGLVGCAGVDGVPLLFDGVPEFDGVPLLFGDVVEEDVEVEDEDVDAGVKGEESEVEVDDAPELQPASQRVAKKITERLPAFQLLVRNFWNSGSGHRPGKGMGIKGLSGLI